MNYKNHLRNQLQEVYSQGYQDQLDENIIKLLMKAGRKVGSGAGDAWDWGVNLIRGADDVVDAADNVLDLPPSINIGMLGRAPDTFNLAVHDLGNLDTIAGFHARDISTPFGALWRRLGLPEPEVWLQWIEDILIGDLTNFVQWLGDVHIGDGRLIDWLQWDSVTGRLSIRDWNGQVFMPNDISDVVNSDSEIFGVLQYFVNIINDGMNNDLAEALTELFGQLTP